MATLYSTEMDNLINQDPSIKNQSNKMEGRMRIAYGSHTFSSNPSSSDVIKMVRLPKGARVYQVLLSTSTNLDSTSTDIDVGWNGGVNGNETADDNGFMDSINFSSSAGIDAMVADGDSSAPVTGYAREFADEVDVEITLDAALDNADTNDINLEVRYVVN